MSASFEQTPMVKAYVLEITDNECTEPWYEHLLDFFLPNWRLYKHCADFSNSEIAKLEDVQLVRQVLIGLLILNSFVTIERNETGFMHMIYYFSYWGSLFTLMSLVASTLAVSYPKWFQVPAVALTECATAFDLVITPLFWTILAPNIFEDWHTVEGFIDNVHYMTTHSIPLLASLFNIYYTSNFKFVLADWKLVFNLGISYIYYNYVGTIAEGHPMYPLADWSNFWLTVFLYGVLAAFDAIAFY